MLGQLRGNDMIKSKLEQPRIATVDSSFNLVGSRQHGLASNDVISWSTDDPYQA